MPVSHHTVPQVYLRQFADRKKRLLAVSRDGNVTEQLTRPNIVRVKDATAIENFYTVYTESGEADVDIENHFSDLENNYRPMMDAVRSGRALCPSDKVRIALMAASQESRTVGQIESWSESVESELGIAESLYRENLPNATDAEITERMRSYIAARDTTPILGAHSPRDLARGYIQPMLAARFEMFSRMNQCLLVSRAQNFITSDHPVVWINWVRWPPQSLMDYSSLHLAQEVTFPLSSRFCILFSYLPVRDRVELPQEAVSIVNARQAVRSYELFMKPTELQVVLDRYRDDIFAGDDCVRGPLWSFCNGEGSITPFFDVVEFLGLDLKDVLRDNIGFIEGLADVEGIEVDPRVYDQL
ncbi:MAG TPA: DUF4238 domain-containing protein [Candidatus Baltobacteraceae bacterium]|jgi:hypothetical protein